MIKQYRKKPVVIEAVQFKYTIDSLEELVKFAGGAMCGGGKDREPSAIGWCKIKTLEGVMTASEGDYIIKGIKGEFYPCREDIFLATYEELTNENKRTY